MKIFNYAILAVTFLLVTSQNLYAARLDWNDQGLATGITERNWEIKDFINKINNSKAFLDPKCLSKYLLSYENQSQLLLSNELFKVEAIIDQKVYHLKFTYSSSKKFSYSCKLK